MAATQRTQRWARKGLLWGGIALGVIVILFLARGTWSVYQKMQEARELRQAAVEEEHNMEVRRTELQAELAQLATPRGVEAEIRARYPLVKPGEQEYILVDASEPATEATSTKPEGIWAWFASFF